MQVDGVPTLQQGGCTTLHPKGNSAPASQVLAVDWRAVPHHLHSADAKYITCPHLHQILQVDLGILPLRSASPKPHRRLSRTSAELRRPGNLVDLETTRSVSTSSGKVDQKLCMLVDCPSRRPPTDFTKSVTPQVGAPQVGATPLSARRPPRSTTTTCRLPQVDHTPGRLAPAATATATAATANATAATAAPTYYTAMAKLRVLAFDHEGRPVQFDTWLDDLQLYLLSDSKDSVSLFYLASRAATAPPAIANSSTRSQWLTRDAAARLAIRNHLPLAECAHFGQHKTAQALYDAVVARYSSPATSALGRLLCPTCSPSCLPLPQTRTSDHILSLDPTSLTVDLLEQHLLAAETSAVVVGAARGTPCPPFFEGCSPSPLAPSYASAAAADVSVPEDVEAASASAKRCSSKGKGGRGGGGGSGGGGGGRGSGGGGSSGGGGGGGSGGGSGGSRGGGGGSGGSGGSGGGGTGGGGTGARRVRSGGGQRQQQHRRSETLIAIFDLEFDAILSAMYALSVSAEGDCYRCVPRDPSIAAPALGASESGTLPISAPAEAFHTFTLDSGASRCFFRDSTSLTPLPAPVFHLPSFFTNLVSTAALQDAMVTPGGQRVSICTCTQTGRHLATFTRRQGSSLYTLATEPSQVAASAQVSAPGQVAASYSCRLLSHQTLLWHHRLGHPSLPRLHGMHSRLLVSCLPRSLPPLPPSPAPPCLPCVEGRQRAAPHSSSFPPTSSPLQTLDMDVWDPARVSGQSRERYFLLIVDDYTPYTTVFPLRNKGQVVDVLIPWIRTVRLQLRKRFGQDLPNLRLHSDRGGEFSSNLLREFCRGEGILLSFTLPDSPQQNGIAERRIGLVMEVARTSMIHAAAPHFLWPFAVQYAAHQLNLWPRVSLPETLPTLRWTGEVGDASVFRSIPFYRLFPYRSTPPPPSVPLRSIPSRPRVLLPETGGADPGGVGTGGAEPWGVEPEGVEPGGAASEGAESGGAEPQCAASSGGSAGASPRLSSQQLREWFVRRARLRSGATGARGAGAARAGGAGVAAGASVVGGAAATGPGGARTRGIEAAGTGGVEGAGVVGPGTGGAGAAGAGVGGTGAGGTGAVDPCAGGAEGTVRPRPYFVPLLQQVLGTQSSTGLTPPLLCPPPDKSQPPLKPASPLPAPSPYTEHTGGLTERREPASHPVLPVCTARRAPRSRPPPVLGTHAIALRPSSVPLRVPLPDPPESSLPVVPDPESDRALAVSPAVSRLLATAVTDPSFESATASALVVELLDFASACRLDYATALVAEFAFASPSSVGGECALGTDVLEDRQEDFECLAAAVPRFASMLLAPEGDPDAPDIPTPRSYAEAIAGPCSSQWQAAMDAEMASWMSTVTYVDEVPPPGANIVDGMWIFRVKRPPGSPPSFKARYVARGFSQRQGVDYLQTFSPTPKVTTLRVLLHVAAQCDYELHSLDFSTAFLQGSLHEEIWLRRPPGFTGTFPAGTQTTLAALGFALSTTDPSLRDTPALTWVLQRFGFQFSSPQPNPPSTSHSLSAPPSDEFVEPSGPYPELVGCLITSGMGLVLGGRDRVVLTGHADASWVDDSATQRSSQGYTFNLGSGSVSWRSTRSSSILSSSCEAEIYAGAMAAQELRWLTYLLIDLGEQPRSPPQRGQLHLAYVATRANTADVFTKALPPGDHQRFATLLGLVPTLPH
ncbi:unnamed protein product [Closterium sp. NIES-53]